MKLKTTTLIAENLDMVRQARRQKVRDQIVAHIDHILEIATPTAVGAMANFIAAFDESLSESRSPTDPTPPKGSIAQRAVHR